MNMTGTSQKDRFMGTLLGTGADRFPFFDLEPDEETVQRWHGEGLPSGTSVADYFALEPHWSVGLTLRSYPFFRKAAHILTDPSSFSRYYDPDEPSRYADNFVERAERLAREGKVIYVDASGGGLLQMLGVGDWDSMVAAAFALIERPRMVEELMDRTTDFYCLCLERALSRVTVDYASLYEPIAANTGPVISPAMFERFAMPGYRKVLGLLEKHNVPLRIFCTTGGDLSPLLPPLIEAGVNGLWISNILSEEMAYDALRRAYGPDIALIGGIDATALTQDEAAIRKAVEDTAAPLLESGRYLPCLNDRPRSNVPFAGYAYFRKLLKEIAGPA
ncbi:MAG: hypothetical protein JRK53_05085 [Deltaproteobacteria bacterium]|nr:hypothetical protein [Deltaproteobacteria bacterium]